MGVKDPIFYLSLAVKTITERSEAGEKLTGEEKWRKNTQLELLFSETLS